ncbi:hypothetical protein JCM8208_001086 [Rhodotorula glutinis]
MDPLAYVDVRNVLTLLPKARHNGSTVFGSQRVYGEGLTARAHALKASWAAASHEQREFFRRKIVALGAQLEGEDSHERFKMDEHLPSVETMREWLGAGAAGPPSSNAQDSPIHFGGTFPPLPSHVDTGNVDPSKDEATLVHMLQSVVKSTKPSGEHLSCDQNLIRHWRASAAAALARVWTTAQSARRIEFYRRLLQLNSRLQGGQITGPAGLPSIALMHEFLLPPPPVREPRWEGGPPSTHPWSLAKPTRAGGGRRSMSRFGASTQQDEGDEQSPFWPVRRSAV